LAERALVSGRRLATFQERGLVGCSVEKAIVNNWDRKRKQWRRDQIVDARLKEDYRSVNILIHEALQRQEERRRLYGYVRLKNGEYITIDEARNRIADGKLGHPKRERMGFGAPITKEDIVEWVTPGTVRDHIDSIAEVDVPLHANYPMLKITEGTVISDPKVDYHIPRF